ncbi:MAG: hypothetical protein F4Z28_05085 [Gammaproteobacteria bacterium]|nr:hypothetical protein [Gammaproteobacteria bacterium]
MIAEVRAELVRRLGAYVDANDAGQVFGPVFGTIPRWTPDALAVHEFPVTFFELFGDRGVDGAWRDEEYGLRVVTMLILSEAAWSRTGDDDPGDPVLAHQLAAMPGNTNGVSVLRDPSFTADEDALSDLLGYLAPVDAGNVLGVTSSFRVIEAGGAAA